MDKAIILGTYEFIGFHLCLTLLDKGLEVTGIHLPSLQEEDYLEEKLFSIGRNSNFTETNEVFLEQQQRWSNKTVFIIDYYSYYSRHKENELKAFIKQLNLSCVAQYILLMPIQLCNENLEEERWIQSLVSCESIQVYYLPTIYGPWQPSHFTFQQALHHPDRSVNVDEREWTNDAIYINDVIKYILNQLDRKGKREILLQSSIKDHWQQVASMLIKQADLKRNHQSIKVSQNVMVVDVKGTVISAGIAQQKRHLERLKQIK
ncbi:hypothetical protein [Bacillus tuaregi]|uniref:hypothetical protein n=1 Tax=Bacillus tuaregi TaxID=1816695 RepID=UPI0008F93931|nr:hypothetical protein [Bacillus tuaregi]